eukprot:TRINITY_DN69003_c0_g1_i3.p4 TRINITY_DN69003_c0_g1~~TRINITY_DN69003_c0_g1_i3.p4  ORF type:complete len:108 (-),score=3.41 TRINITY_DN69003_c0_g1_i3:261-542(-)
MSQLLSGTQQYSLALLTGFATMTFFYLDTKRFVWRSSKELAYTFPGAPEKPVKRKVVTPFFGPEGRAYLADAWNTGISLTLGTLAKELSRRGL